jgi:hypothetical protein
MAENEIKDEIIITPLMPLEPEQEYKMIDSPEMIVRDMLKTEKEIALETLRVMRSRNEKERFEWERLYGGKEREILDLKKRLGESEERIRSMKTQLDDERQKLVEQVRQKAKEFESERLSGIKKWEIIDEEIKSFRTASQNSQARLLKEQENIEILKREAQKKEKYLQERINANDDETAKLKEQLLNKEETLLKYKSEKDEEVRLLQDSVASLKSILSDEKQEKGKVIEKNETDLESLKKALQDTVIQLNIERSKKEGALEALEKQALRIKELEEELKKTAQKYESDRAGLMESYREEQSAWEKYKKEFAVREESLRRETEEQVTRILKSVEIIEQQLSEEQRLKKTAEDKLRTKDEEIQKLVAQKDEIAIEWRKMLAAEQELRLKRQAEILGEFDKVRAAREEDFRTLRVEINNLQAALAEENKLYILEKEQNKQLIQKTAYLEENRQSLISQLEAKEKTWREAISSEQELYKKQIEETANSSEAKVKARDSEITRLDEDSTMLNGQILELRQKLSMEKNENNNRLDRISEFESQMKSLTSKYNQERTQWHQKFQFIQQQWEEQRNSLIDYQKDLEIQYNKDVMALNERIKVLTEKIREKSYNSGTGEDAGTKNQIDGENRSNGKYYPRK